MAAPHVWLRWRAAAAEVLAVVEKASRLGTYRRVGMLVMPTELEDPEKIKLQILDSLDWRQEVVTII